MKKSFWSITKQDKPFRVAAWFVAILVLLTNGISDIKIIKIMPSIWIFITSIIGQIVGVILSWYITFYVLKTIALIFERLEKKYKISRIAKTTAFKITVIIFIIVYFLAYAWAMLKISPSVFTSLFLDIYSKNKLSPLMLLILTCILVGISVVLYAVKIFSIIIIELLRKKKWKLYGWLIKVNGYLIFAIGLMILSLFIGMNTLNNFKYSLPFEASVGLINISCGDNIVTEIVQNEPFPCNLEYYGEENKTPQTIIFTFINNNGTENFYIYHLNIQNNTQRIGVMPPSNVNMLSNIKTLSPNDTSENRKDMYLVVYDIKEFRNINQSRFTSLFAIITFSFLSIFGGVYYLKGIMEKENTKK